MQEAAYMVVVPNLVSDTPALRKNPIFIYYMDRFQKPAPFRPDVVVAIDDVWETKLDAIDAHVSQVYEWLPWVAGRSAEIPADPAGRKKWLDGWRAQRVSDEIRAALEKRYGAERAGQVKRYEAFELCEYGRQSSLEELNKLFPK
jgi:LmbE family N-acetylglucosaminyl deacetylase